jgi:hypothetical protein
MGSRYSNYDQIDRKESKKIFKDPYPKNLLDFQKYGKTRFSEKVSEFVFFRVLLLILESSGKKRS